MVEPFTGEFYDAEYFTGPTKSNYYPYGPGHWATWICDMIVEYLAPSSVLDVGCAYGYILLGMDNRGVRAIGFDISEFAVEEGRKMGLGSSIWVGDASDPAAYEPAGRVDLIVSTEVGEHLTPDQVERYLANCRAHGERMLLLVCTHRGDAPHESADGDASHINVQPVEWWVERIERAGWEIVEPNPFNTDTRSVQMQWDGRFFYLR